MNNPFSIEYSTGYWVTRLAKSMEHDFENRLKIHGITRAVFAILSGIAHDKKATPRALEKFIGIDGAAITRHLDKVEQLGLLVRERSARDRRSISLKLTAKGMRLVKKLVLESKATNEKFLAGFTHTEIEVLQDTLRKMLDNGNVVPPDI